MSAERVRLRFNGAEVGTRRGGDASNLGGDASNLGGDASTAPARSEATRLAEAGVTDGSTLDLMIEPVDRDHEPEPDTEPEPEPEPAAAPVVNREEKDTLSVSTTQCACCVCGEMREKADFSATVWKRPQAQRVCKHCVGKEMTCHLCSKPRDWCYYTGLNHQIKRECDVCTQSGQCAVKFCSGCNQTKLRMDFSNNQAQRKKTVRMCQVCMGNAKEDKSIAFKLRERGVIVISSEIPRGWKKCGNCGELKPSDQFTKSQRQRATSARRCLVCLGKDSTLNPPESTLNHPESDTDEQLNRHEVVEKEAVGDGGWNEGGDGWVNLVKESGDDLEDDVEEDVEDDGFDDYYEEENEERNGDSRRASVNASLGLPDEEDAEFLDASDYERDSLSGDSHENCELYGTLHSQVSSFASTAGPDDSDLQNRLVIQKKVSEAIAALYPEARLEVFGSGATGLALKCADIDLVVLGVGPEPSAGGGGFSRNDREDLVRMLRKIEKSLRREKIVWKANVISTAKVPIIKMNAGRYAVDLTVGASNGLSAVQWIKDQVTDFVAMRPLILVLKKLLKTHHLDDASTGGCGGYLLVSLVVSHLRQSGEPGRSANPNLGALLLGFLRRFGYDFDYARMAVAAGRPSGVIRGKDLVVNPGAFGRRPMILAEDPQVSVARAVSFFLLPVSSSLRVCRVDDGTPGAMIIIAFLVLSVGLASCSMKRLGSVPLLSARRRPAATQNPTPAAYSFISHPFTNAHARSCSRRKPAATSPGRRTASRRSVPCSAPRRRPCPPRVSSRSCRRWPRTRPSAGARRRRRRSRAAGAGGPVRRGFRTSEASLSSDRGRRELASRRVRPTRRESPCPRRESPLPKFGTIKSVFCFIKKRRPTTINKRRPTTRRTRMRVVSRIKG